MHDSTGNAAGAGFVALAVAMGIGRFAFTPLLPMMQADAGLTVVEGGWLAAANYAGYLAGALTALAMRGSPAGVVRSGLALVGVSTLAMAFVPHLAAALALRALAGVASAWVLVFASAWGLDHIQSAASPSRRAVPRAPSCRWRARAHPRRGSRWAACRSRLPRRCGIASRTRAIAEMNVAGMM